MHQVLIIALPTAGGYALYKGHVTLGVILLVAAMGAAFAAGANAGISYEKQQASTGPGSN